MNEITHTQNLCTLEAWLNAAWVVMPKQSSTWPAVLADLLPQGDGRRRLAQHLDLPAERPASDWPLLLAGAGNPIGHLRIREAAEVIADLRKAS